MDNDYTIVRNRNYAEHYSRRTEIQSGQWSNTIAVWDPVIFALFWVASPCSFLILYIHVHVHIFIITYSTDVPMCRKLYRQLYMKHIMYST